MDLEDAVVFVTRVPAAPEQLLPEAETTREETGLGARGCGSGVCAAPRGHAHQPLGAASPVLIFWFSVPNWGELFPLGDRPCRPRCLLSEEWPSVPPPGPVSPLSRLSPRWGPPRMSSTCHSSISRSAWPLCPRRGRMQKRNTHTQSSSVGVSFGIGRVLWWLLWTVPRDCHSVKQVEQVAVRASDLQL